MHFNWKHHVTIYLEAISVIFITELIHKNFPLDFGKRGMHILFQKNESGVSQWPFQIKESFMACFKFYKPDFHNTLLTGILKTIK